MNRTPIYSKDRSEYRICSFPGGLWQFQRHNGTKGKNRGKRLVDGKSVECSHESPWEALGRVTEFAVAKRQLDTLTPPSASP